jgi:signal transduction histidine kinase
MKKGSLRLRLFAAGAVSILLALTIAAVGLMLLFERHVERRVVLELEADLRQLVSGLNSTADGALEVSRFPAEPRFLEPLSGLYWQIVQQSTGTVLRSRSLWDSMLDLPPDVLAVGEVHRHQIRGPYGAPVLTVERSITLPAELGAGRIRVALAVDHREVAAAARAFGADLLPALAGLALVLITAAWVQVVIGLRPLDAVRCRLGEVRAGHAARLGAAFPDEVRPLTAEVDHLLDAQEKAMGRARARAADLAHGLKTPLTVLASTVDDLRDRGDVAVADEVASVANGMRRHVERELARARAGLPGRGGLHQPVRPVIDQVVEVLRRTPRGQDLDWQINLDGRLGAAVDPQDLAELLGNLAENAAKWANLTVRFTGHAVDDGVTIAVDDDGPGIPDDAIGTALVRGGRLDEAQPGTGLGLAIVSDLVEAYGGSLTLGRSPLGGLRAAIRLPSRH